MAFDKKSYMKEYNKRKYHERAEFHRQRGKKYYNENKEKIKKYRKKYSSLHYKKNKEKYLSNASKYYVENKEKIISRQSQEKYKIKNRQWVINNRYRYKAYRAKRKDKKRIEEVNRKKNNLNYRLSSILRGRIYQVLKKQKQKKNNRTADLIGCSIDEFKKYIECGFKINMTWENYGKNGWSLDHIIPCAAFDLSNESEKKECFNFSNLQPLWISENCAKSSIYNGKKLIHKKN